MACRRRVRKAGLLGEEVAVGAQPCTRVGAPAFRSSARCAVADLVVQRHRMPSAVLFHAQRRIRQVEQPKAGDVAVRSPDASSADGRRRAGRSRAASGCCARPRTTFAGSACRRRKPGRSVSDHLPSTGTWFHCQTGCSLTRPRNRRCARRARVTGCGVAVFGLTQVRGVRPRLPGRPKYGQPSFHVIGERPSRRPTELKSIIEKPHHSPAGVSTTPPWCSEGVAWPRVGRAIAERRVLPAPPSGGSPGPCRSPRRG
jgi:hypothetical protein